MVERTSQLRQRSSGDVAAIIATWNSGSCIEACLGSLIPESPAEVVVVDNGSGDQTVELVRRLCPEATIIENTRNLGFAAACNIGIAETSAPFVLTLNDDAQLEPGYLEALVGKLAGDSRAASAVGKMVYRVGGRRHIDSAGILLRRYALSPVDRGYGEIDRGQYDRAAEIFGPSAAAALYRRAALDELGVEVFDEDLFAYYEDVDLAWRLRRRGWTHLYEPAAIVRHRRRGPANRPPPLAARAFANRYLVWLRNEELWRFSAYAPVAAAWEAVRVVRRLVTQPRVLAGIPHAARTASKVLAKRRSDHRAI